MSSSSLPGFLPRLVSSVIRGAAPASLSIRDKSSGVMIPGIPSASAVRAGWRAYAALHLWSSEPIADRLAEAQTITPLSGTPNDRQAA